MPLECNKACPYKDKKILAVEPFEFDPNSYWCAQCAHEQLVHTEGELSRLAEHDGWRRFHVFGKR